MKERLFDVIKWGLIIIIAGTVYYGVQVLSNRYVIVGVGERTAYKMDKVTGQVWQELNNTERIVTLK